MIQLSRRTTDDIINTYGAFSVYTHCDWLAWLMVENESKNAENQGVGGQKCEIEYFII